MSSATPKRKREEPEYDLSQLLGPGYHTRKITRGVLGDASKITEEYEEFMDALDQDVDIMALVELSDLFGAISAWLEKNHPSITVNDLLHMNEVTQRAFRNGHR